MGSKFGSQLHGKLLSQHGREKEWREYILQGGLMSALESQRPESKVLRDLYVHWSGEEGLNEMLTAHDRAVMQYEVQELPEIKIEKLRSQACQLVAAAGLADALRDRPDNLEVTHQWLSEALGGHAPNSIEIQQQQQVSQSLSPLKSLLAHFDRCEHDGVVRIACLRLLGVEPRQKISNIPIVFVSTETNDCVLGRLELRLYANGRGQLIQDPGVFKVYDEDWETAFANSWNHLSQEFGNHDVVWRLSCPSLQVGRSSAQAALESGLHLLKLGNPWPEGICVSAAVETVDGQRQLTIVDGIFGVGNAFGAKVELAANEGLKLITFEGAKSLEHESVIPVASMGDVLQVLSDAVEGDFEFKSHRNEGITDHDWYRVFNFHSPDNKRVVSHWLNGWENHDEVLVLKGKEDSGRKYLLRSTLMAELEADYAYLYFPPLAGCTFPANIAAFTKRWFGNRGWENEQSERLISKLSSNFRPSQDFCLVLASAVHHAKRMRDVEKCFDHLLKQLPPDRNELSLLTEYLTWASKKRRAIIHVDDTRTLNLATLGRLLNATRLCRECKIAVSISDSEYSDDVCIGLKFQELKVQTIGVVGKLNEYLNGVFTPAANREICPILWEVTHGMRYDLGQYCVWLYQKAAIEQTEEGWQICESAESVEILVSTIQSQILAKLDDASRLNPNFRRFVGIASCFEAAIPFKLVTSAMNLNEAESEDLEDFLDDEICESGYGLLVSLGFREPGFHQIATYSFENKLVRDALRKVAPAENLTIKRLAGLVNKEKLIDGLVKARMRAFLWRNAGRSPHSKLTNEMKWYVMESDAHFLRESLVEKLNCGNVSPEILLLWVSANKNNHTLHFSCYSAIQAVEASDLGFPVAFHRLFFYSKSFLEYQLERFEIALSSISLLLSSNDSLNLDDVEGLLLKSRILFELDRYDEALQTIDQSLKVLENESEKNTLGFAACLDQKANILESLGCLEDALDAIDLSLQVYELLGCNGTCEFAIHLNTRSSIFIRLLRLGEAFTYSNQALQVAEALDGKHTRNYAISLSNSADILNRLSRNEEALQYVDQSLQIHEMTFRKGSKFYSNGLKIRSDALVGLGRRDEALRIIDEALCILDLATGNNTLQYAIQLEMKALILVQLDRNDEALQTIDLSLGVFNTTSGDNSLYFAHALNTKAVVFRNIGRYLEAIQTNERALDIQEKKTGMDASGSVGILTIRALILGDMGRRHERILTIDKSLQLCEKVAGRNTWEYARQLSIRATVLQLDDLDDALTSIDQSLGILDNIFGNNTKQYALGLKTRALILHRNRPDDALTSIDQSLLGLENNLGIDIREYADALGLRADILTTLDRPEEANASIDQCLEVLRNNIGINTKEYALGLKTRALILHRNRPDGALASIDQSLLGFENNLGSDIREYAGALELRANILTTLDRPEEALVSFDQSLEVLENTFGINTYEHVLGLERRADILKTLDRSEEALVDIDQSLQILENTSGFNSYEYGNALSKRADILNTLDRSEEALADIDQSLQILGGPWAPLSKAVRFTSRAKILDNLDQPEEALASIDQSLQILKNTQGFITIEYAMTSVFKGYILGKLDQIDEALLTVDRGLEILEQICGGKTEDYATMLGAKVKIFERNNLFDEALKTISQELEIFKNTTGENTKEYARALKRRTEILSRRDSFQEEF